MGGGSAAVVDREVEWERGLVWFWELVWLDVDSSGPSLRFGRLVERLWSLFSGVAERSRRDRFRSR